MDGGVYTRFVHLAKILLPLIALALLSTLFLLSRAPGTEPDIPYAELEAIARRQGISQPDVALVTADGVRVVAGARLVSLGGDATQAEDIRLSLTTVAGAFTQISAETGRIDDAMQVARLEGLARIETSTGFFMETVGLSAQLAKGRVTSDGALALRTPFGELNAGRLLIEPSGSGQRLLFHNGVRLLYTPGSQIGETQ